ncbi:MAG: ABC transporter permease [Bacillota bacterium]
MQVYKALFKVIKKNLPMLMIYVVVFLFFAIFLSNVNTNPLEEDFTETKVNMVFINNDGDSLLAAGLEGYLGQNANFVFIPDESKQLQDALFFKEVEYILKIPKGFTASFLAGSETELTKAAAPGSTSELYLNSLINKYLNTVRIYLSYTANLTIEELLARAEEDLAQKTTVRLEALTGKTETTKSEKCAYYYNYLAYSLIATLTLGVGAVMVVFNNLDLKRRTLCSPVKLRDLNLQLILGNLSYGLAAWLVMILASIIMYGSYMFSGKGLLFLLNSFIFTLAILSLSFLIANVIKSLNAANAVANVIALGSSFISGVFVPQALLGKTVLTIAGFTPTYWYVKTNNLIAELVYQPHDLKPIFGNMLIVIGFAIGILLLTVVITKQKRTSSG